MLDFGHRREWTIGFAITMLVTSSLLGLPQVSRAIMPVQPTIEVKVSSQQGNPLNGVTVQGFMETVKVGVGATGLQQVFMVSTGPDGRVVITDLSGILSISADWLSYQGLNAKYFSPRVLLFITYTNASGFVFFEEDSVHLITLDFLNHQSATINHALNLSRPIPGLKVSKINTATHESLSYSGSIFGSSTLTLPNPPHAALTYWVFDHTDGPYPSSCCGNIPIAWGQVSGGAYASLSVNLLASQTDYVNTGYATGQGSQLSGPTYYSGSAISSFQNQANFAQTINLNLCVSGSCSPSTAEVWINGQFEGDKFELFACCDPNGYPIDQGQGAYEIGIVNVPVSGGRIQGGWDYNLPQYVSYSAFGQDFSQPQFGGTYSGSGNPTPQHQITSYDIALQYVGNQFQWYANLALTGLSVVPLLPAQVASTLGGIINNLVGPIGSYSPSAASSWIQYDAPIGQQVYAMTRISNTQWQVSGMSSPGHVPIEGYYGYANPPLSCSAGASPTSGYRQVTVQFTATCSGGTLPYHYNWQFNDSTGSTSTLQNPSYTYWWQGTCCSQFYPTLTVTDSGVSSSNPSVPRIAVYCNSSCPFSPLPSQS